MAKQRFIKVTVTYYEGEGLQSWNATELGETSLFRLIEGRDSSQFDGISETVWSATAELVNRSERLIPPKLELLEEVATT